jgi:hypothetical protein
MAQSSEPRSSGMTAADVLSYLDTRTPPTLHPDHVRAYREAAAVLESIADLDRLRPVGAAPPGRAAELLAPDLVPAIGEAFHGTVMLRPQVRAETISALVADGRVWKALDTNPWERSGLLQEQFERYLTGAPGPLVRRLPELEATLQVAVWLSGVVTGVPAVAEVAARVEYLRLLAQFEALAGDDVFRGRRKELDQLRSYTGVVPPESTGERVRKRLTRWVTPQRQPAISISGIGGAGKSSLVARFMLEHTRQPDEERVPFGYLDFARTSLDVGQPVGLARELLRQLDLQFPDQHFARGFGFLDDWRPAPADDAVTADSTASVGPAMSVLADVLGMLRSRLGPRPYVIVLDTFEEIQYGGEERAFPLWELLSRLQDGAPFLRVVVAGRAEVESLKLAGRPPRQIVLDDLDEAAAMAFVAAQGIADPQLQRGFIATFGRMPLSLKLATALSARTPGGASALLGPGADGLSLASASDEVIQARLYGRILDRIADERVSRLAHPGLTLRRINPALIFNVLNEPCELLIETIEEAAALFAELHRESSLVSVDNADGDLVHRPDLRRVMLTLMLNGGPAVIADIHRRALAWYGRVETFSRSHQDQAEYLYHWLHLRRGDQTGVNVIQALAQPEVRASIQASVDEFPVDSQLWLATRGFKVSPEVRVQASRDQDHAAIAAQIEDLLPYGERAIAQAAGIFEEAYAGLRDDRGSVRSAARSAFGLVDRGASPVFLAGARIAAQRGDEERALALIGEGLERAARDDDGALTLGLLKERAWLYRDRPPADQVDGLELLWSHALRQDDAAARLQYRAQSVAGAPGAVDAASLTALLEELLRADGLAVWQVVPALGRAVALANDLSIGDGSFRLGTNISSTTTITTTAAGRVVKRSSAGPLVLADRLAPLVLDPLSPFRMAVFPDPEWQDALNAVTACASADSARQVADRFFPASSSTPAGTATGWRSVVRAITGAVSDAAFTADEESGALGPAHQVVFLTAFMRLCAVWPYRILHVQPPQGRGVTRELAE